MKYVESKQEFEQLLNNRVLVVDFYADWCGPCRMLGPTIEELASEYAGNAEIVKLNVDNVEGVAERYGVQSIPTVIFFKNGVEVDRIIGYRPKQDYVKIIESL